MEDVGLIDRMFLLGCKAIPDPKAKEQPDGTKGYEAKQAIDPLKDVRKWYGAEFELIFNLRVFCDFGCGGGYVPLQAAELGATKAYGVDIYPAKFAGSQQRANERGLPVQYVTAAEQIQAGSVDIVLSQNSFEHFQDPERILDDIYRMMKPGGTFFCHFGPPWKHPFGVHNYFMVRWPWMHLMYSEERFMRWRPYFRPHENNQGKTRWHHTGLNCMTIKRFEELAAQSGFEMRSLKLHGVGGVPSPIVRLFREYLTSHVVARLVKP
jgi:SAM-dependent methyltransferase